MYLAPSLTTEGFIHCSNAEQVLRVAEATFKEQIELVLLTFAPEHLKPAVVYENTEGGVELFPHVYGPINRDAVVAVEALNRDSHGVFLAPPTLLAAANGEAV